MKINIALATAVAFVATVTTNTAQAQHVDVNCAALKGSPLMCVKNSSPFPVVALQATSNSGFISNNWINIPGGPINPGGTSIVKFDAWQGGCRQFVTIRTMDGRTHTYPNVDVCNSTSFTVTGW